MPQPTDPIRLLRNVRQVREFTSEPIADDVLNDILEVGRWTGTGGNRQPIDLLVVKDPAIKPKFVDWGARPAGGAAVVFVLVSEGDGNAVDEGRMAERLMIAAKAHGLGAGIATLKNQGPAEVKAQFGIPAEKRTVVVVAIGHIDQEARKALPPAQNAGRKPLEQYAHRDRW